MVEPSSPWRGVQWRWVDNTSGLGATGTMMVLSTSRRIFEVRGVAVTGTGSMMLYDHTNRPQNPLLQLTPTIGQPDPGWQKPLHLAVQRGLYVSFSMGTGGLGLAVAHERQERG